MFLALVLRKGNASILQRDVHTVGLCDGLYALAAKKITCNCQDTTTPVTGSSTTVVTIGRYLSTEKGTEFNEQYFASTVDV